MKNYIPLPSVLVPIILIMLLYLIIFLFFLVKFHISHLYEVQNNYKKAKEGYEQLLGDKQLTQQLKADVCRQLGEIQKSYKS